MSERTGRRETLVAAALALAVLLATVALILTYAGRTVLRAQPFADRAVAALKDPAVRDDVADHVTSAIVGSGSGDLAAVRPLVRTLVGAVVGTRAFAALLRRAVLELHASLIERHPRKLLLTVADAGVLIQGLLERFAPDAARQVGAERVATLGSLDPGGALLAAVRLVRRIYVAAWGLAVLALLIAAGALCLSRERRRAARRLGFGLGCGGLGIVALYAFGGRIASQLAQTGRGDAVHALWQAYLHGLLLQGILVAGAGVMLAAAASPSAGAVRTIADPMAAARRVTGEGASLRARALVSGALVLMAVVIVLEPGQAVTVAAIGAGLVLGYRGAAGMLTVLRAGVAGMRPASVVSRWARRGVRVGAPVLAVAALAAVATVIATGAADEAPAATGAACNGYAALCPRRLNQVALAATHNSYASVTIPSWLFGQQDGTILDQLNDGIRGLLIDTYYGFATDGGVRTDLATLPKRQLAVQQVGPEAVKAAERIRSRLGSQPAGKRAIFLCHGFCEIGAVSLSSALADLRAFLVTHPTEVVVVINQDEGVTPPDIERAFADAGLLDLVYRGPLGPFPTLRTMIDSNQRLVVMAENDAGDIPWYHLAYRSALQETPFTFKRAAQLTDPAQLPASCADNRGPSTAPLFLLNHWVDTTPVPRASLAAEVNAREALLTRSETCQRIRHRHPNLVAVDFFRRGDVLGVVRTLNGLAR